MLGGAPAQDASIVPARAATDACGTARGGGDGRVEGEPDHRARGGAQAMQNRIKGQISTDQGVQ